MNTIEAVDLFARKYSEKYEGQKLELGEKAIAIFKNCTMIVELNEDNELKVNFSGSEPIYIDENLDLYVMDSESDESNWKKYTSEIRDKQYDREL